MSRVMLDGSRLCTIFCFAFTLCVNYVMKGFCWFVPLLEVNNFCVLCTVKAKNMNKNTSKNLVRLQNHPPASPSS